MASALLHIGLEKTGTTAIQEFLQLNRSTLLQQHGIWIADYLGPASQWPLAVLAYDELRNDDLTTSLGAPDERQARLDDIRQRITRSVADQPADLYCFSCEHLSSRLTSNHEILRLKSYLDQLFQRIQVVLYVREPIRMAISRQSTYVKMGLGRFSLPDPAHNASIVDFQLVIQRWESLFPGSVAVRLYDENSPSFDVITDFCDLLGLSSASQQLQRPTRANRSLCWEHMRLLSRINELALERSGQPLPRPTLRRIIQRLEAIDRHAISQPWTYQPSREQLRAYAEFYAAKSAWLFSTYFPERQAGWTTRDEEAEQSPHSHTQSLDLSTAEEALCALVVDLALS